MKITFLKVLTFSIISVVITTPAFAASQYIDCLRTETSERVIINIFDDAQSGTFFATTGLSDGPEERTPALVLKRVDENADVVNFEALDGSRVFTVAMPVEMIHRSSTSFLVDIGAHPLNGSVSQGITFACFSTLYDR